MTAPFPSTGHLPQAPEIPTDQLLVEVYTQAAPAVQSGMLSKLVGKVYQSAAPEERSVLVRQLMQPLGILSLLAVANGVFAKLRLQGGLSGWSTRLDEVQVDDVVELASFVQQVSGQALHSLALWLSASPVLLSSAAAVMLVKLLLERATPGREAELPL